MSSYEETRGKIYDRVVVITSSLCRYEGFLVSFDKTDSTFTLSQVHAYGTEDRDAPQAYAGSPLLYQMVEFRLADVKDLKFIDPRILTDPAIVSASGQVDGGLHPQECVLVQPGGTRSVVEYGGSIAACHLQEQRALHSCPSGSNEMGVESLGPLSAGASVSGGRTTAKPSSYVGPPESHYDAASAIGGYRVPVANRVTGAAGTVAFTQGATANPTTMTSTTRTSSSKASLTGSPGAIVSHGSGREHQHQRHHHHHHNHHHHHHQPRRDAKDYDSVYTSCYNNSNNNNNDDDDDDGDHNNNNNKNNNHSGASSNTSSCEYDCRSNIGASSVITDFGANGRPHSRHEWGAINPRSEGSFPQKHPGVQLPPTDEFNFEEGIEEFTRLKLSSPPCHDWEDSDSVEGGKSADDLRASLTSTPVDAGRGAAAYDKEKSFFDNLSESSTFEARRQNRRRGGGGGGGLFQGGRLRNPNVETFGEDTVKELYEIRKYAPDPRSSLRNGSLNTSRSSINSTGAYSTYHYHNNNNYSSNNNHSRTGYFSSRNTLARGRQLYEGAYV